MKAALLTMPGTPLEIATDVDIARTAGEVRVA